MKEDWFSWRRIGLFGVGLVKLVEHWSRIGLVGERLVELA